mgnify:CR=1 FL=1|tara:strand:- start:854 stop:1462 length:609 start_codon:yes stop_codon:yes gene_type:complete
MSSEIKINTISEVTSANGVSIDGLNIKDSAVNTGTISDSVTQPATDYIFGALDDGASVSAEMINLSGSTDPHANWTGSITSFGDGGGSTVTGTTVHDFKFRTKGIYYISFSCTISRPSDGDTRFFKNGIRGNGSTSESTTTLAQAMDQVANTGSSTDSGNAFCAYTGLFNANDLINFYVESDTTADLHSSTHFSIFKLRSVA